MLADEVTHVKMGSDWLRRLTETDPDRRERALEFQRTVDAIFNLGGFRGEDDENPIQLARELPPARRLHRGRERLARRARPRVDRAGARDGRDGRPPRSTRRPRVRDLVSRSPSRPTRSRSSRTTRPRSRRSSRRRPRSPGIPPGVDIVLTVDEELFAPLTGHMSDVVDGKVVLWISGGNFEDNKRPTHFSADQARVDLAIMMLRAKDRLSDDFAAAPPDAQLSRGERAAWDTYAVGRARRLGVDVRRPRQLYDFRLQHGFTDVADAAFERLLGRRAHHLGRHPRDLQGDRRRRPRPVQGPRRPPPPEVTWSQATERLAARERVRLTPASSTSRSRFGRRERRQLLEVVGGDRVVEVDLGLRSRCARSRPRAMSVMSGESRWRLDRVGRLPLLDHAGSAPRCVTDATRSTFRHAGSWRVSTT